MNKFYRWCCDITLYVFKILIELRTHQKNTKHRGVATEVLWRWFLPYRLLFVFIREIREVRMKGRIDMRKTNKKKSHKEFVNELKEKNPNIRVIGQYQTAKDKIECECLICNTHWFVRRTCIYGNCLQYNKVIR